MSFEDIVRKILSKFKDLSSEDILSLIEKKKMEAKGYLTDEGAARIIASELGVEVEYPRRDEHVEIGDLTSGLSDVTFSGRVLAVYPTKIFKREDGTEGRFIRLEVGDSKGVIPVIVWDDKVDFVYKKNLTRGDIVKILHGYVRYGLKSNPEVHLGFKGDIEILPRKLFDDCYPPVEHFYHKVRDLHKDVHRATLMGFVHEISDIQEFKRSDGTSGKVRRIKLGDETGDLTVILWDDKVDELYTLKIGDMLEVVNGKVRRFEDGFIELHVGTGSLTTLLGNYFEAERPKIKDVIANINFGRRLKILGKIFNISKIRVFKRGDGSKGEVAKVIIGDGTGIMQLNLWDEKSEYVKNLKVGDVIFVDGAYIRRRHGKISLNLSGYGYLKINPDLEEAENLRRLEIKPKKIVDLTEGDCLVTIEGELTSPPKINEIDVTGGKTWLAILEVRDETGSVSFKAWGEYIHKVKDLKEGSKIKIVKAFVS
ncbi:MAG: OB-fold nucleic acid binding domain-containing protein, partial [Candidatus Bathyarchaeia archaeon]